MISLNSWAHRSCHSDDLQVISWIILAWSNWSQVNHSHLTYLTRVWSFLKLPFDCSSIKLRSDRVEEHIRSAMDSYWAIWAKSSSYRRLQLWGPLQCLSVCLVITSPLHLFLSKYSVPKHGLNVIQLNGVFFEIYLIRFSKADWWAVRNETTDTVLSYNLTLKSTEYAYVHDTTTIYV